MAKYIRLLALHLQLKTTILKRFVSTVMYTFNNFKYSKELSGVLCKLRFQACILSAEDKHWKIHVIYFFSGHENLWKQVIRSIVSLTRHLKFSLCNFSSLLITRSSWKELTLSLKTNSQHSWIPFDKFSKKCERWK